MTEKTKSILEFADKPTSTAKDLYASMFGGTNNVEIQGENTSTEKIYHLPIGELVFYEDQHFSMHPEDKLVEMAEDIKKSGVRSPVIVRPYKSMYQVLDGRNRTNASKLAGKDTIPCLVVDADDNEAKLIVANTNLYQRENISHSEKAFGYRMQYEANKQQGKRTDLEESNLNDEKPSLVKVESKSNIRRYIRLTYLIPELLQMIDNSNLIFMAGVNLSYLDPEYQKMIFNFIVENKVKVTLNQSEEAKKLDTIDELELASVFGLLPKEEKKGKYKMAASTKKIIESKFADKGLSDDEITDILDRLISEYFSNEK